MPVSRRRPWPSPAFLLGAAFGAAYSLPGFAQAPPEAILRPTDVLSVEGQFIEEGKTRPAENLSGIACLPPRPDGSRECLVVNDENQAAQRAKLSGRVLTAGAAVPLIGPSPPTNALGGIPSIVCPRGQDDFKEFDGEGVAFAPSAVGAGGTYYVVGSHGCTRRRERTRLSTFLLARIPVDADGMPGAPELTWRLADALRPTDDRHPFSRFFARALMTENGLNIESVVATGEGLLFGMRAPSVDGMTYIASVPIAALFAPGPPNDVERAKVAPVRLGANAGIRDMSVLPDGRLIILSGPAQEQPEVKYSFWVLDRRDGVERDPTCLGHLEEVRINDATMKAEAVTVLSVEGRSARVLVLFDGIGNGGPREYRIDLQTAVACR
jgi:hypothetical protein